MRISFSRREVLMTVELYFSSLLNLDRNIQRKHKDKKKEDKDVVSANNNPCRANSVLQSCPVFHSVPTENGVDFSKWFAIVFGGRVQCLTDLSIKFAEIISISRHQSTLLNLGIPMLWLSRVCDHVVFNHNVTFMMRNLYA